MSGFDKLISRIKDGARIGVLTGAGISTNSGIPDFRSSRENSVYSHIPESALSLTSFSLDVPQFYANFIAKFRYIYNAEPTKAHRIIADWENRGIVNSVITQNVDMLHQKAGSLNVFNYHGDAYTFKKVGVTFTSPSYSIGRTVLIPTDTVFNLHDILGTDPIQVIKNLGSFEELDPSGIPYYCKPNVVLFGEDVHFDDEQMEVILSDIDILLIVGTTYQVSPFNRLHTLSRINSLQDIFVINDSMIQHNMRDHMTNIYGDIDIIFETLDNELQGYKNK